MNEWGGGPSWWPSEEFLQLQSFELCNAAWSLWPWLVSEVLPADSHRRWTTN
jgi:hypothetical protein